MDLFRYLHAQKVGRKNWDAAFKKSHLQIFNFGNPRLALRNQTNHP